MGTNFSRPAPLPVIRIIRDTFQFVWDKRVRMLRALSIPMVIMFALEAVPYINSMLIETYNDLPGEFNRIDFGLLLISVPFYVLFAITCHRIALIGDGGVPAYGQLNWSKRETRFLGWCMVIPMTYLLLIILLPIAFGILYTAYPYLKNSVPDFIESFWAEWFIYLLMLPSTYIIARFSLIFPTVALDREVDTTRVWNLSHYNSWRLTVVVGILPWVFAFFEGLLLRDEATLVEELFVVFIGLLLLAVEVVALSFSYKHLTESASQEPPT